MMNWIIAVADWFWSWPLFVFIVFAAVLITIGSRFVQFRHFVYMWKTTILRIFDKSPDGEGTISPFQAAASSLSGTIGIGNLAGVGLAIGLGGPGALFWMWVVSIFSMITKYAEVVLGVQYREYDEDIGEYRSGPMYYIKNGLKGNWKWLAALYAVSMSFVFLVYFFPQSNTVAVAMNTLVGLPPLWTGIGLAILCALVVFGGLKNIARVAEKVVPFMTVVYILATLLLLITNVTKIPHAFGMVFGDAFSGTAAIGGFAGSVLSNTIRHGFARGVYSNDGGLGVGALFHGTAITPHPVKQGMWGLMEVFLDTDIVCTCTAIAILTSGVWDNGLVGLELTASAFEQGLPFATGGAYLVCIAAFLFGFTTVMANFFNCEVSISYLFRNHIGKRHWTKQHGYVLRAVLLVMIVFGAIGALDVVWGLTDFVVVICMLVNLPVLCVKVPEVARLTKEFFSGDIYKADVAQFRAKKKKRSGAA